MIDVTIQLPDDLGASLGETPSHRSRRVLEYTAVEEYRAGRITQRQVGELLGLDYWETEQFLRARRVPIEYGMADLEEDRATLAAIFGSS